MGTGLADPKISGYVVNWALPGMPRLLRKFAFGCEILGKVLKSCYLENVHGHCKNGNCISKWNVVIHLVMFSSKSGV